MAHAAIPMAAKAVGVGAGGALVSKLFGGPPKLTPQGTAAQAGLNQNAGILRGIGQAQIAQGGAMGRAGERQVDQASSNINAAGNYWRALASGNTAATSAAIAPQVGQITQAYRGAASSLDRGNVRGPIREIAEADMARERAGQIGGLVLAQRPAAISGLVDLERGQQQVGLQRMGYGNQAASLGVSALTGSSGPLAQVYSGEQRRTELGAMNQAQIGQFFANLIYDMMRKGKAA